MNWDAVADNLDVNKVFDDFFKQVYHPLLQSLFPVYQSKW